MDLYAIAKDKRIIQTIISGFFAINKLILVAITNSTTIAAASIRILTVIFKSILRIKT
jgi:hypothetical protein